MFDDTDGLIYSPDDNSNPFTQWKVSNAEDFLTALSQSSNWNDRESIKTLQAALDFVKKYLRK